MFNAFENAFPLFSIIALSLKQIVKIDFHSSDQYFNRGTGKVQRDYAAGQV